MREKEKEINKVKDGSCEKILKRMIDRTKIDREENDRERKEREREREKK